MKVQVRKIRPEGMELEESLNPEWVGLTRKDSARFIAPIAFKAEITRADNEMLAKIAASSQYESFCFRCLEVIKRDWMSDFTLNFAIDKQTEFIELDEDIRQELILNLPARILCSQDCKGLCIDCGANLNKQECEHKHSVISNT